MISGQGIHGGGGDRVNRFVHSLGKLLREVADQERNIAVALAKWRDLDWENIQPEEQVGAEFLFGDHRFQIAVWKRSEEHTSELQSRVDLVCRLLLEKKKKEKRTK